MIGTPIFSLNPSHYRSSLFSQKQHKPQKQRAADPGRPEAFRVKVIDAKKERCHAERDDENGKDETFADARDLPKFTYDVLRRDLHAGLSAARGHEKV